MSYYPSMYYVYLPDMVGKFKGNPAGDTTFVGDLGGASPTLLAGDAIVGYGTGNVFEITDFGSSGIPSISVKGIQTVDISSDEGFSLDTTGWTGLQLLEVVASNGTDNFTLGDATSLVAVDTNDDNVYVTGGVYDKVVNNPAAGAYGNYVQVNGGAATTTVKIKNGYDEENYIYDLNNGSVKTNTITTVYIKNEVDYDTYIYSNALQQLFLTSITYHYVYDYSTSSAGLNLTLDNDGNAAGYGSVYWYFQAGNAQSLSVSTTGASSNNFYLYAPDATLLSFNDAVGLSFYDGNAAGSDYLEAAAATKLKITGAGAFEADLSGLSSTAAFRAQTSSGAMTVELASASGSKGGQSFLGGSGRDIVAIGASQTGTVVGGGASDNEIVLDNIAGASETTIPTTLVSNFSILGVGGSTDGLFDLAGLPAYDAFDIQGAGGDLSFTNVANAYRLAVDASDSDVVLLGAAQPVAGSETILQLGTASTNGVTAADVQFRNIAHVVLVSRGSGVNVVADLGGSVTTLDLIGSAGLTLDQLPASALTINGASYDADASLTLGDANNVVTLGGGADSVTVGTGLNTITFGAHVGNADAVTVGANGSLTNLTTVSGAALGDSVTIADMSTFDATAVTSAQAVAASGGDNSLADWVAGAVSSLGADLAQHAAAWFQFQGETFLVEQAAATGAAFATADTLVELKGLLDLSQGAVSAHTLTL